MMGRATGETHHPAPHPPQRFSNPPTQHSPATARIRRLLMGFACGSTHPTLLQREGAEGEQRTVENDWFPNGHGGTRHIRFVGYRLGFRSWALMSRPARFAAFATTRCLPRATGLTLPAPGQHEHHIHRGHKTVQGRVAVRTAADPQLDLVVPRRTADQRNGFPYAQRPDEPA